MERVACKMRLKAGFEEEYRRRHDELWPEMAKALKEAGISDYSIFLDPSTLSLFAVQKRSPGSTADELPGKAVVRRWWSYMKDIMETNPDDSPVAEDLVEVFHLD
ncbi:MAG TPA: L-rhamnose mutarotase [Spirochaetales bacterium]|nr:L-rhamnose mutarotase [Spirochaetales bacterium]HRY55886.1 L-rhamnose mutarotase [Spirochaetia bacterium]HRZ63486.1 L-rhamnose mutarotase [Spirochaetia bacterium]